MSGQATLDLGGPAPLSEERRARFDVDRTPLAIPHAVYGEIETELPTVRRVLVPAAGSGPWAQAARERWPTAEITAVEIREEERAGLGRWCDVVHVGDIRGVVPRLRGPFDLVADNPAFSLWKVTTCAHEPRMRRAKSGKWAATPICKHCGERKSQAEALRAYVANLRPLLAPKGLLVMYWLSDLGQRATGEGSRSLWDIHRPLYQMRVQPVEHREGKGVDLRSYSVWTWDRDPVDGRRWTAWDLPPLPKAARRWAPT